MGGMSWAASRPVAVTERLTLSDTSITAIMKLSEGNPGALRVCAEMLKNGPAIDPFGMDGLAALMNLDSLGIYGSRIWLLYKDVCREDLVVTMACLRGCQLGIVNKKDLLKAIENADSGNRGNNLDLVAILAAVKERLGNFGNIQESTALSALEQGPLVPSMQPEPSPAPAKKTDESERVIALE